MTTDHATGHSTGRTTDDTDSSTIRDQRTIAELTCDLTVVSHRVRDLARWVPEHATGHLDAALLSIDAALDSLHAEHRTRATAGGPSAP